MTHILFITRYYPPERAAPAVRISETARYLVRQGYQLTVLTTVPNHPTGIVPPEYRDRLIQHEDHDGIHVVRVWSYASPNKGFLRRILSHLSFGFLAPFLGWRDIGRPDVIIVQSPPLFTAIGGRILAWLKRCPFIFTVSDLWPESAVQLGVLRNRLFIRLAEWLEWSTYQRAGLVWAVTEGIRNVLIDRGLPPEKVFLLTNGVDTNKFRPLPQAQARAKFGWNGQFTVLFAGTHGIATGLNIILDAAEQMRDCTDIGFVLVGDGAAKAELIAQAQRCNLTNVTFLDPVPHDSMPQLLSAADVCVVHTRKLPLFEGALPSKIYEVMACARPMLLGVAGEARRLVEQEAGAAIYVEPENANELVSAVLYLYEHPEVAETLGKRGRAFVEARFDRAQLTTALEAHIAMLLGKNVPISMSAVPIGVKATAEKS